MAAPEEINADMLAFWNGKGGDVWVARQEHTDVTLAPVTDALLAFAAPRAGERVVDIGCGCGTCTLEFARAVNPSGRVAGLDISGPMLAEGERRASAAAAGWAPPRFEKLDMDLDIAAGRGLEEAVVQSTQIGAVNSWLRNQPAEVVSAVTASVYEALAPYADGARVRLPGAMWLISSAPA